MDTRSDRLRICLVSAAYLPYPSGVSEHVAQLAVELQRLGHQVDVLTTRFGGSDAMSPEPDPTVTAPGDAPVRVHRVGRAVLLPANGSFATLPVGLRMPSQVRGFLAGRDFDIVHCHGFAFPEIAYWAIRYSRSINIVSLLAAGYVVRRRGGGLFRAVFQRHLARIDAVIALSKWAQECHAAYIPGPYTIVPSGVDLTRFHPDVSGLPESNGSRPTTVLFVGRLDVRKGLDVLLPAFASASRSVPSARLCVVGSGPGEASARREVASLGIGDRVVFAGRVSRAEMPRYFAGAGLYVSPALGGESFGIVLLEAMASGAPVIASNIPGYDEVVRHEIDGLLVPPGDVPALSNAIVRLFTEPGLAEEFSRAGTSRAAEFAWPEIARRTAAVYTDAREAQTRSSTSP